MAVSDYNKNTNWDNERTYLNNLVSGGGGNAVWAKKQLNDLNAAQQQYGGTNNAPRTDNTGAIENLAQRAVNVINTASENDKAEQKQMEYLRQLEAQREAEAQKQAELEKYLRQQYLANTQSALARLKGAYESGLAGYNTQEEGLGGLYDAARNRAAAQTALERMNFNERAAASGLNSGASGQAELARSSVQQSTLAGIDKAQADAQRQIDLAKNQLAANYEQAAAETRANYDSQLAQDLYQEMLRQQAESDAALEAKLAEAQSAATPAKPTLTAAQTLQALKSGVVNDATKAAYEYYYGQPYDTGTQTGTVVSPVYTPTVSYNNGGLSSEQVRQLQAMLGVSQDGYWGPATQAAANAMWGTTDADKAYRAASGSSAYKNSVTNGSKTKLDYDADEGIFTWNGMRYNSLDALKAALNSVSMTQAEIAEITRKLSAYGFNVT